MFHRSTIQIEQVEIENNSFRLSSDVQSWTHAYGRLTDLEEPFTEKTWNPVLLYYKWHTLPMATLSKGRTSV